MASCERFNAIPFGPTETFVGTLDQGMPVERHWADPITIAPVAGANNLFEVYNYTVDAHPMHLHGARVQVQNRESLVLNADGSVAIPAALSGEVTPPALTELGYKDSVIALPGTVTRIRAHFDYAGLFVWHCHIVEHEDNEMMVPMCARRSSSDKACLDSPGGKPWPIVNNGNGLSY